MFLIKKQGNSQLCCEQSVNVGHYSLGPYKQVVGRKYTKTKATRNYLPAHTLITVASSIRAFHAPHTHYSTDICPLHYRPLVQDDIFLGTNFFEIERLASRDGESRTEALELEPGHDLPETAFSSPCPDTLFAH
jgi:hypothetical protein